MPLSPPSSVLVFPLGGGWRRGAIFTAFYPNDQFVDPPFTGSFAYIVTIKTPFGVIMFRSKGLQYYVESIYKV
jgi:hypothetical protein